MRSVPLGTQDASGDKSYGRAPSSARPTLSSGSARLAIEATDATKRNCAGLSWPLVATLRRTSSRKSARGSRLDGQYGTEAVLSDLAGFAFVARGKEYTVLDHPLVQARLHLPPDQSQQRPESQVARSLYDCPDVPVGSEGVRCRMIVATHPTGQKKSPVGVTRAGVVYELFFTTLPQQAFTACDVVELYLHRGAFEPAPADEDEEQDPDRWCSHSAWGQECWQVVAQWIWNRRLELGHHLKPSSLRTTEFAPALADGPEARAKLAPVQGYGAPAVALRRIAGRFSRQDFMLQPSGVLQCPEGKTLRPTEQRREADSSMRILYSARIRDCRDCPLRQQCQWHGDATTKPRRISLLLHPLQVGPAPLFWRDWSRREHRRACLQLVRHQRGKVTLPPSVAASSRTADVILTRSQRAHTRLAWTERLARNARPKVAGQVTIKLFGVPNDFAIWLGLTAG